MKRFLTIFFASLLAVAAFAQEVPEGESPDSLAGSSWAPKVKKAALVSYGAGRAYAETPASHLVEIFRPNYFIIGMPVDRRPDEDNCNIKFQASVRLNLFRNVGKNKDWDIFGAYSQISVWNVFADSSPFYDNTYIPGFYVYHPFRNKAGEVTNSILFGFEHRSNGRDGALSRSVNYLFASYSHYFPCNLMLQATGRFGFGYVEDEAGFEMFNKYLGYVTFSGAWTTRRRDFEAMLSVTPVFGGTVANVTAELGYRLSEKLGNPYVFLQFHYGYDEAQRDCDPAFRPVPMVRFGLTYTPHTFMRSLYY